MQPTEGEDEQGSSPAAPDSHEASLLRHRKCRYELPHEQSSRPGPPCIPPAKVWPYKSNTSWRTDLGERIVKAVTPRITTEQCGGWTMFGDMCWCNKAMQRKDVLGLSFGIEERDLYSEYLSNKFGHRTRLYDCFQNPRDSPPLAGTAPNATQACQWGAGHCYEAPYEAYKVCLGPKKTNIEGREFNTLHNHLKGLGRLSVHLKIDVEGSEWTVLEDFIASVKDQDKVRTLDMEVHFGFKASSESEHFNDAEQDRLIREISILEGLRERFYCTGSTLEVYRQGWKPEEECKKLCDEPIVHLAGGFTPKMFAVSFVNKAIVDGATGDDGDILGSARVTSAQQAVVAREAADEAEAAASGSSSSDDAGDAGPPAAPRPPVERRREKGCKSDNPRREQSSRPGVPCLPPAPVWPYQTNTPWRSTLGERIVDAVTPHVTKEQCDGFTLFGDQTWCNKAMGAKHVMALSFGIEERDMYSEYLANHWGVPSMLFDCFQDPKDSPPLKGTAPNGTGSCKRAGGHHCYEAPYWAYRTCLGAKKATVDGRKYDTLPNHLKSHKKLSVHLKIDVEGSEWTPLEAFAASDEAQSKVRTLDMEVHFGFTAQSEASYSGWTEKKRLEREVGIFEQLHRRFYITGTTLEVYREGWLPHQDCPQQQCGEPAVHLTGGFSPRMFAVSLVNRDIIDNDDEPQEAALEVEEGATEGDVAELGSKARAGEYRAKYGFYLHVYMDPAAVVHQVRQVKKHFPGSPIYVMSDGGNDFSGLCKQEGCQFTLCPPANDRWHPWPFLRRLFDGALWLDTEYVIMLEPDNTIHRGITREPTADAGGLPVPGRRFGVREYVQELAQAHKPGYKYTDRAMEAGLAGGAYFRMKAILDSFNDEHVMGMNWNRLAEIGSKEVFSSDFAMQYLLASRGWSIEPWDDCAQMDRDKDTPLAGLVDSAFRHYCSCYPGGKPTYNLHLALADRRLVGNQLPKHAAATSVCQLCYNYTKYVHDWGSTKCTNSIPFTYAKSIMSKYFPDGKYPQMVAGT